MGLFSRDKPKIKIQTTKKDGFSGWLKCSHCADLIHANELTQNHNCCPKCDYHYRLTASQRVESLSDSGTFKEMDVHLQPIDSLEFVDSQSYKERIVKAQDKSGRDEAIITGTCKLEGIPIALAVLDFNFMAGSMGSVMGEKLTRIIEHAAEKHLPMVIVSCSGGARMQESILSLMQMAKTSAALARLHDLKIPYISVLTNPTTGGVTASFASLGDVIIAEPGALICFAGPRVIEQTIGEKLPEGAQKAEFLLEHGMIDFIARRPELKQQLHLSLSFLTGNDREFDRDLLDACEDEEPTRLPQKLRELMQLTDNNGRQNDV